MRKFIILSAAAAMIFSSCGGRGSSIKTEIDSLSYAMGMDFGSYIKQVDSTYELNLNIHSVLAGVKEASKGNPRMTQEEQMSFLSEYFSVRIPAKIKAKGEAWLNEIEKSNPSIRRTESGILYLIIEPGTTKPGLTDTVVVNYTGRLRNEQVFDSSVERGEPARFALNRVIPGWSEGMQLVGQGGKINLWIPTDLAYGAMGAGNMIGPNEPLFFEVELIEVIPGKAE